MARHGQLFEQPILNSPYERRSEHWELSRLALKLAAGARKTTVMAMLITEAKEVEVLNTDGQSME